MQKDIENKLLKKENQKLEKEIKNLKKEKLKDRAKIEFLEKRMPSCMNLSKEQMKIQTSKKAWKNDAYNIIFYDNSVELNLKDKCKALFVNYSNYAKWKIKYHDILSRGKTTKLKRKYNKRAIELINKFTKLNGASGARNVSSWITDNHAVNISYKIVNELRNNKLVKLPKIKRVAKKYTSQRGNVVPDLIKKDFKSQYNFHKIGLDGSYLDLIINGKKTKILGEFAYNWYNRDMIAYNFDFSENSQVVSKTIMDIINVVSNYKVDYSIIQMDRGTANTSNIVKNIIECYPNFVLSMSEAGFKHNAPTESLNGWFKECFFAEYGNIFLSIQEFLNKFDEFIIKRNSLQTYIYNKKRSQII
ncbi:hypothetical protein [Spiroplasma turonicum]|uniref:Integrase catalytic domain-containing protein n=2 Tax=Spiroplasma turonicum TaxID=216946 RepID=A0A0K1P6B4_9MOLU|nr:hypothetical protein [Spiroplasma turonicum]AKU79846.1 hypothetical protein STURON_00600 [Spiroplasma turonicum]ALX70863.1 hypothetical protein STURO_v1c05970 [Spiroplasma turonicum]